MKSLSIIGIGPGHPDQITLQAIEAMRGTDVFFLVRKHGDGAADVSELDRIRAGFCTRHLAEGSYRIVEIVDAARDRHPSAYREAVRDWHAERAQRYENAFAELADDERGAFLVWGDPALYDSTIRIVRDVLAAGRVGFDWQVIPGVTSVAALAAAHRTVLHQVGDPVVITTGRRLFDPLVGGLDDVAVMLDGKLACADLADPRDWDIHWGANLGTPAEVLVSGPLSEVLPELTRVRESLRRVRGWVMDTYLLHRRR